MRILGTLKHTLASHLIHSFSDCSLVDTGLLANFSKRQAPPPQFLGLIIDSSETGGLARRLPLRGEVAKPAITLSMKNDCQK